MELFYSFIAVVVAIMFGLWFVSAICNIFESKGCSKVLRTVVTVIGYIAAICGFITWIISQVRKYKFGSISLLDPNYDTLKATSNVLGLVITVSLVIVLVLVFAVFVLYIVSLLLKDKHSFTSKKNLKVDLLLCTFAGPFGAHRFYEGKKLTGSLYIVLTVVTAVFVILSGIKVISNPLHLIISVITTLLECVLVALVVFDLIKMITYDRKDSEGNYILRWNLDASKTSETTPAIVSGYIEEKKQPAILKVIQPAAVVYIVFTVIFLVGGLSLGL